MFKKSQLTNPFDIRYYKHPLTTDMKLANGIRAGDVLPGKQYKKFQDPLIKFTVPRLTQTRTVQFTTPQLPEKRKTMTGAFSNFNPSKVTPNRKFPVRPNLQSKDIIHVKATKANDVKSLLRCVNPELSERKFYSSVRGSENMDDVVDENECIRMTVLWN